MNKILFSDLCAATHIVTGIDILTRNRNAAFYRKIVLYLACSRLVSSTKDSLQKQQDVATLLGLTKSTASIQLKEVVELLNMHGTYADRFRDSVEKIWSMALLVAKETQFKNIPFHVNQSYVCYDGTARSISAISNMIKEARLSLTVLRAGELNEIVRLDENNDLWIPSSTRELLVRKTDYVILDHGHIRVIDRHAFEVTIFGR